MNSPRFFQLLVWDDFTGERPGWYWEDDDSERPAGPFATRRAAVEAFQEFRPEFSSKEQSNDR